MPGLVVGRPAFTVAVGPKLVPFTTRTGMHKQGFPTTDTTGHTSHHLMRVTADGANTIRARYGFWGWLAADALPAQTLLIDAALVKPDGTIVPFTFNDGNSTLTVTTDGAIKPSYDTDPLVGTTLTRGDLAYVRTFARAQAGSVSFGNTWYSDSTSLSWYQAGNHLNDPVSGAPAAPGPAYSNTSYCHPIALLGYQTTQLPSFFCWGDSNMANSDQFSWYERALGFRYPYMRANSAGAGLGSGTRTEVLAQVLGNTLAIIAMGTNNFGSNVATNLPLLQAAITAFRAQGIQKVLVCTLPPTTTSTDGWTTAANQTPTAGTTPNREDLNDAIRAMASSPGESNADAVYDAASYVEVAADNLFTINGKAWRIGSGGIAPFYFGTGPHYEERGMAAAAVGGALAIDRIVSGETGFLQQNPNLGT